MIVRPVPAQRTHRGLGSAVVSVGDLLLLLVAGVGAGLSGSMAGLASLFSYPALLAVGLPPTTANMTNTVALMASTIGSVAGSRPELAGQGHRVRTMAPIVVGGGALGAGLLFLTPPGGFEKVVPFLVAVASALLLLQPRISAAVASEAGVEPSRRSRVLVLAGIGLVGVYGGYFGAAAGVLILALLLIGLPVSLLQANGLKNALLGLSNGTAAIAFAFLGDVRWAAVAPMAVGVLAGSWVGPALARRIPTTLLRTAIGLAGIGLAVKLAIDAF
ncbi:MAG: sulfite exporter TauE/SafE family protein [Pseudonocardia sp.]|nr:sulfite exporter TauE/SafE family protein [Pseudonocardia sp.]ODU20680.1 MAG: transporter [Pseudonocardia sp. SCN 72-51]ODV06163.1 MAG: transporter [Pseudonocardia sp. SCN 73-27]